MSRTVRYARHAERPALAIWWADETGALIDFSSNYTFSLKIGQRGHAALLTKTSGITGFAGSGTEPSGVANIQVTWTAGELDITPGTYTGQLTATTSALDRVLEFTIQIVDTVT